MEGRGWREERVEGRGWREERVEGGLILEFVATLSALELPYMGLSDMCC